MVERAVEFRAGIASKAELVAAGFDRDTPVDAQLKTIKPHIVIDAGGPFQAYGDDRYRIARSALAFGIHYLDLADDAAFVAAGALAPRLRSIWMETDPAAEILHSIMLDKRHPILLWSVLM